jgi:glycine dehydrogenase subunit 1
MPSPYVPNTDADRSTMLREIGVGSIEELFQDIPEKLRLASSSYRALSLSWN